MEIERNVDGKMKKFTLTSEEVWQAAKNWKEHATSLADRSRDAADALELLDDEYYDSQAQTEDEIYKWNDETFVLNEDALKERVSLMYRAKDLINDFCTKEYGSSAYFGDLRQVGLAYTTVTEIELPDWIREDAATFQLNRYENDLQVNVNLEDLRLERFVNGVLADSTQYSSLEQFISTQLEWLDFDSLVSFSMEEVTEARKIPMEQLNELSYKDQFRIVLAMEFPETIENEKLQEELYEQFMESDEAGFFSSDFRALAEKVIELRDEQEQKSELGEDIFI
ncbi:MAG: hypothetical protein MR303_11020 [Emergencia sp.]|nr:hypothetical protein [Emergencia sp.]